ncbi:MAG TPA: hypothetical protein VJT69_00190 [Pyrinomonadaceae bacterium]|nr:hypothetical protein [Pyrinomonadaceae bacterium]
MSDPKLEKLMDPNLKIKIHTVHGGRDRAVLKHCFFYPSFAEEHVYVFCDKDGTVLADNVRSGFPFHFHLHHLKWTIPDPTGTEPFVINHKDARGSWHNDSPDNPDDPAVETGTFTAQATGGGTVVEESASSANA